MKVLIVPSDVDDVVASARYLASTLTISGIETVVQDPHELEQPACALEEVALVVVMGGDGTVIRAAHLIGFAHIPILAFNYGTLAFISGSPMREPAELIKDALAGDIIFDHRSTATVEITQADGQLQVFTALNEVAYTRGRSGRMVEYSYGINGITIARLKADGLIASTPTGSTGYALSAGGPIVSPAYKGLVVVPVAPHSLNARAIVLAPSDVLEVSIEASRAKDASIFIDGIELEIENPLSILVKRSEHDLLLARGGDDFFRSVSRVFFGGPYPDMPQD